jgi:hypothetical protein
MGHTPRNPPTSATPRKSHLVAPNERGISPVEHIETSIEVTI